MLSRPGSDFSSERFHEGPNSVRGNGSIAAARGSDVSFGKGGFEPPAASHELVHTVRQHGASGHGSLSVPAGTVQRTLSGLFRKKTASKGAPAAAPVPAPAPAVRNLSGPNGLFGSIIDDYDGRPPAAPAAAVDDAVIESAPPPASVFGLPTEASPEERERFIKLMEEEDDDDDDDAVPFLDLDKEEEEEEDDDDERDIAADLPEILNDKKGPASVNPKAADETGDEEDDVEAGKMILINGKIYQPVIDVSTGELLLIDEDGEIYDKDGHPFTDSSEPEELPEEESVSTGSTYMNDDSDLGEFAHHSMGWYRPGFSSVGKMKKGSAVAGAVNGGIGAFKGADEIGDLITIDDLRWGARSQSEDYNTTEGPFLEGATSLISTGTALVNTVTGAHETIRKGANVKAGASSADAVTAGMDTLSSAGTVLSSGAKFLNTVGATVGGAADFIPGMNIATGALTAASGGVQAFRGIRSLRKINKEIDLLKGRVRARRRRERAEKELEQDWTVLSDDPGFGGSSVGVEADEREEESAAESPEPRIEEEEKVETPEEIMQNKLWQIFHQGKWVSEYNRTSGLMKTGSGVLTASSGVATLTGAGAAVGAGLGLASGAMAAGRFAYDKGKKKHIRRRVIAQELGMTAEDLKDDNRRARNMRRKWRNTSEKEVFAQINKNRARYLLETAGWDSLKTDDEDAVAADHVINALGVHRKKNGGYAEGALDLLAEKLGAG